MNTQTNTAIIRRMIQRIEAEDVEVNLPFYYFSKGPHVEEYHRVTEVPNVPYKRLQESKVTFYDGLPWAYHQELPFAETLPADARIISYGEFADAVGQVAQVMENTLLEIERHQAMLKVAEEV